MPWENKISYGMKRMSLAHQLELYKVLMFQKGSLTGKKLSEDENLSKIQDQLGSQLGGVFGKGGPAGGIGSVLSKSL
ncbi:hypothetical protein N7470_000377 [Penicillium chermesinum]|nr:hypothetical protein N7470_000377 [Penicillium chermesinum]